MHRSAWLRMEWFVNNYIPTNKKVKVLDVGSYDVNGSYRSLFEGYQIEYIGLDMEAGPNVDYVPQNPYSWDEIADDSIDYIISGNAFEHIEFPWLTMEQIYKKLKLGGMACILAPFTIGEHRYPTDCYRYYPDGFRALAKWASLSVVDVTLGGIPQNADMDQWKTENLDDTMMIVAKSNDEKLLNSVPKLEKEFRIGPYSRWKARYLFLVGWIGNEKKAEVIRNFFVKNEIKNIYIYGWGHIGKILLKELDKCDVAFRGVIDKNADKIGDITTFGLEDRIVFSDDTCIINTVLDENLTENLKKKYDQIKVFDIREIIG